MRKRDLGILIISTLSIFYSLQKEGSFSFRESWFHLLDESYPIKHEAERLPPPVVADLNGDGRYEVIVATHESKLQVLEPDLRHFDEGFNEARVVAEVSLLPERVRIAAGRRPVAMATGTVDRFYSNQQSKKHVIVVVTAGWSIICFDHNLKKLWETNVQDDFPHGGYHKEVAITISNYTLNHGDVGLVLVGGSMEVQPQLHLDPFEEELIAEREAERHRHSADKDGAEEVNAGKDHHFTYYAFAGTTGTLRWSHKSKDFHRDYPSSAELVPQHNYKLDASSLKQRKHPEAECKEFRESILSVMPHRWQSKEDTRFELANFRKHPRKQHKKLPGDKRSRVLQPPDETHAPGKDPKNKVAQFLSKSAEYATSSKSKKRYPYMPVITNWTKQWWLPNVVVAHLKEGIEAVDLANGETVCKLWLQEGGLHADINGDGVLDHVQAVGGERVVAGGSMEAIKPCSAIATSGVPVREQLFNGSICKHSSFGAFQHGEFVSRTFGRHLDSIPVEVVAPIVFPRPEERLPRKRTHGEVIFLTNRGEVTAYAAGSLHSHEGYQVWQIITGAIWSNRPSLSSFGIDKAVPTLAAVSMRRHGPPEAILAAGEQEAVLISPLGHQITSFSLPATPVHPLIVTDFSGDGFNDVILVTAGGVYGFVQTQQPGAIFFSSLVGCLVVIMCVVLVTQHLNSPKGKPRRRSTDL